MLLSGARQTVPLGPAAGAASLSMETGSAWYRSCRARYSDSSSVLSPYPAAAAPRFPSSLETRRGILEAIARRNDKYARPFDGGRMAFISLIGTESWSDYGAVVLQMAILDTLLSIEEKLGALTPPETET